MGVEKALSNARPCVSSFLHAVLGAPVAEAPSIGEAEYLFPNCVWRPGWNRLWSGVVEFTFNALGGFAQKLASMRIVVGLFANRPYRQHFAEFLESHALHDTASQMRAPFHASFLHCRWNTRSATLQKLARSSPIVEQWFFLCEYRAGKDGASLSVARRLAADEAFWRWVRTLNWLAQHMESARLWGSVCSGQGDAAQRSVEFLRKTRHLPEARRCVSDWVAATIEHRRNKCAMEQCEGSRRRGSVSGMRCGVVLCAVEVQVLVAAALHLLGGIV